MNNECNSAKKKRRAKIRMKKSNNNKNRIDSKNRIICHRISKIRRRKKKVEQTITHAYTTKHKQTREWNEHKIAEKKKKTFLFKCHVCDMKCYIE